MILGILLEVLNGLYISTALIDDADLLTAVKRGILPAHMREARLWPMRRKRRWLSTVFPLSTTQSLKPRTGCNSQTASRYHVEALNRGVERQGLVSRVAPVAAMPARLSGSIAASMRSGLA